MQFNLSFLTFNSLGLTPIVIFNTIVGLLYFLAFFYQTVYFFKALLHKSLVSFPVAEHKRRFAFVIAAHNEETVIGNLVRSIKDQNYPAELIDIYVVADACTDDTAGEAQRAGAIVWERNDLARKGKSWVLDYAFDRIATEKPGYYDDFIIFDADNLLSPDYVSIMNDAFEQGFLALTSYRNSKNFDSSWVSAANAIWFLREARYLNSPRTLMGTSCAISGSGWGVDARLVEAMHGWDFHTLTEDIQFSTFCAANGIRIGFAPAEFFDEQPITMRESWVQRLRWTKGFYQIFFSYVGDLLNGMGKGRFSSYDMFMTIAPGMFITLASVLVNAVYLLLGSVSHGYLATPNELRACVGSLFMVFAMMYATFFIVALTTTISEYSHIHAKRSAIIKNLFTFPFFMYTYIPITVQALFQKVEWVPTKHTVATTLNDVVGKTPDEAPTA